VAEAPGRAWPYARQVALKPANRPATSGWMHSSYSSSGLAPPPPPPYTWSNVNECGPAQTWTRGNFSAAHQRQSADLRVCTWPRLRLARRDAEALLAALQQLRRHKRPDVHAHADRALAAAVRVPRVGTCWLSIPHLAPALFALVQIFWPFFELCLGWLIYLTS